MLPSFARPLAAILSALALAACAGGSTGLTPSQHRSSNAKQTTPASFTIQWTNSRAPAAVRRADAISPSAQSVVVMINGTQAAVANRSGNGSQTIPLIAPVGNDAFIFNVYDGPNGQGHLLGSATVQQLIVDGAANTVTAVIQAVCALTNVVAAYDPLAYPQTTRSGFDAPTLASIVIAGQTPAELTVGPEDVDGNVIIASTAGTVQAGITGAASITQIDGAHISLTPQSGSRSTTPSTLTVAAPTCPSTTVAVSQSPAIYVEDTSGTVFTYDWYGDRLGAGGGYLSSGDALIGYNPTTKKIMTYNATSGAVNAYSIDLSSHTTLFTILANSVVTWSNYTQSVFAAFALFGNVEYYTYNNGNVVLTLVNENPPAALAASTFPNEPYVFAAIGGSTVWAFNAANGNYLSSGSAAGPIVSLATDDRNNALYSFNSSGSYVSQFSESNLSSTPFSANDGFSTAPVVGAADTDNDDVYAVLTNTGFYGSSYQGTLFTGGGFGAGVGTGLAIAVISTNE